MKIETSLFASLASTTLAAGVFQLNFTRALKSTPSRYTSGVDDVKPFEGILENLRYYYSIDIQIGTPAQTISVDIDTGSSDLFVNAADNSGCDDSCHSLGTFDSSSSSSYSLINTGFSIHYGDNTGATGNWVNDKIEAGDVDVPLTFAVATDSSTGRGIFGIGYASLGGRGLDSGDYINYPTALVKAGVINSQTYSIYLNSIDADSGVVLFGGVDQSKYTGTLGTVPLTSSTRTIVTLNNLKLSDGSFTSESIDVLLDTGTTLTYLPVDLIASIAQSVGATGSEDDNGKTTYIGPCDSSSKTLDFTFGCATVSVPISNFQTALSSQDGNCLLRLKPSGRHNILGDSFLRSAYIVFDLDNQQASIAQASLNASGSNNIQVIPATPNSIPGATVCSA